MLMYDDKRYGDCEYSNAEKADDTSIIFLERLDSKNIIVLV